MQRDRDWEQPLQLLESHDWRKFHSSLIVLQRQRELQDPNDILIEAERLRQQLAAQEHPQEE